MPDYQRHFAAVAPRYDDLREEETTAEVVDWLAEALGLAGGEAFADVGCGTGSTTAALARRFALDAVGVDRSAEMLSAATARGCAECRFVRARAESLPFADDSFDRVLMQTTVHLMDRDRAFPEVRRVLRPGGRLVVLSVDPAGIDEFWLADWFPSYAAIDRARFPDLETLDDELSRAGFTDTTTLRRARIMRFTRDRALAMLRGRFASSFAVIGDDEYRAGVERAERDMPERFTATLPLYIIAAR
jgi:SAM-dependent methyltransferase